MSNLPISSRYISKPNEPVSDAERNQLSTQLNDAFTRGELDQLSYDALLDRVFDAKVLGELVPVVEKLGKPATHDQPAIVQQGEGRPGELAPIKSPKAGTLVAVVGGLATIAAILIVLLVILL